MTQTRRSILGLGASAGVLAQRRRRRPNILFIMVDEMRWDVMGCAGHPMVKTPNLDRLAAQGTRFDACYTASPVCCPARATAFTGRYAHVHGVERNGMPACPGEIFLPTILKHYGYRTAIAGKLHYRPAHFSYGFDDFWSFSSEGPTPEKGHIAHLRNKYGGQGGKWAAAEGTQPWPDHPLGRDVGRFKFAKEDFETEWLTDRSIEFLRSRQGQSEPFFLFTSYLKPHSPSIEPEPYFSMYDAAKVAVPKLPAPRALTPDDPRNEMHDETMMRRMTALYFGAVTHVDAEVGRLLAELDRLGLAEETIVLFTADHGNMLGERGRWFKDLQYDGAARVPLIWRGVKGAAENQGRVVRDPVDNTGLVPAILESAGLPVPEGVQGKNLLRTRPRYVFSQLSHGMVVERNWKLIDRSLDGSGPFELYDLVRDPKEQDNRAAAEPKRVAEMRKALAAFRAGRPAPIRIAGLELPDYARITEAERRKIGAAELEGQRQRRGRHD